MTIRKRHHILVSLKKRSTAESLKINLYRKKSGNERIIIMIGGFGDDRNYFKNICHKIIEVKSDCDVCSYSIRGLETGKSFPVFQQIIDLREVLDLLIKRGYQTFDLVCTSMGSISMTAVMVDKKYDKYIKNGIYLDPADYYLKFDILTEPDTWSGYVKYEPKEPTVSILLRNLDSDVKVSVISFLLKNCINNNYLYSEYSKRGVDVPNGHSRLSVDMTRSFFENTPIKNKGEYIENKSLPHGFERDGNVAKNEKEIVSIVSVLIK